MSRLSRMLLPGAARKLLRGHRPILIDYPPSPRPRWGYGHPAHRALDDILARNRGAYRQRLEEILGCRESLARIPTHGAASTGEPYWLNSYFPGLDAAALYSFVAHRAPRRYVEIGSGHSTRFAARAIRDRGLQTSITTLDPAPRASVEGLSSNILRRRLEDTAPEQIDSLVAPGDLLFFDGSHRVLQNSDATVFFLEILPRLPAGVLVHVHDVFLPYDYPPGWEDRWYSEQYLLAAYLLGGGAGMRIELPNAFISEDDELRHVLDPLWDAPGLEGVERYGGSFWFETVAKTAR